MLSKRAEATRTCSHCPKLCRPACPVANVTGDDALSAWGIASGLDPVARQKAPATEAVLAPAFACTGCGRCEAACELANPVLEIVRSARWEARALELLPDRVRATDAKRQAREQAAFARGTARFGPTPARATGTVLFAGCTRVATEPESVEGARQLIERLEGPVTVLADACCGAPWLDAGAYVEFLLRAENVRARLSGVTRVIALDPGCAVTMSSVAREHGIEPTAVLPFERWAQDRSNALPHGVLRDLGTVAVHDACRLGRGLGVHDAPRAIIARLVGRPALELRERGDRALCSGAGGALPDAEPRIAAAITDELVSQVRDSGADHVVTGCPSARRRLARAGLSAWTAVELCMEAAARAAREGA
jgi:Fe-S oxidoreductase